ncbi:hypothetical protein [Helicobacter salomonis]|uniref:hypothetical protein n=1 Tax=Helicobacter salomonis TaxID=56878 RepID=UPI002D77F4F6|nr:hypothetical protein [Helicobacter salomonis]
MQEQEQIVDVIAKIEQERTILENTMKSLKRQWEVILKKYLDLNIWPCLQRPKQPPNFCYNPPYAKL